MTVSCCPAIALACWNTWRGYLTRVTRAACATLTSLLVAAVAAVLAGARSFTAIGEWVAEPPPQVLACLGVRHDPLVRRFGKAVRGARRASSDGQAVHLLGVIDQQAGAVLA